MTFRRAFYAILVVVLVHSILLFTDGYFLIQWIDGPMHLAGGFAIGMLALAIHRFETNRTHIKPVSIWYHYLFVIGFVALIAVLWEFHEYILDHTLTVWMGWPQAQISLQDTMADLLLGLLGGTFAFLCYRKE
ncbi:hypothetical protein HZA87_04295 [Candidatus Uhrbacteria bacterium]|nr:hypothetical protein [Candidatus Uhrbacteria bacterium]